MEKPKHTIASTTSCSSRQSTRARRLRRFGIHYKTHERMVRKGLVPATKLRSWQFRLSVLSDWFNVQLKSNSEKDPPANKKKEKPRK